MPGQTVGYIRVSTMDQNTERQLDGRQPSSTDFLVRTPAARNWKR